MAVNSRARVSQTHRTILFESFTDSSDDESQDLCTFLRRAKENGPINEMGADLAKLEVRSFDEFLKKFSPRVYEYVAPGADGLEFKYTTRRSDAPANAPTIELANHSYFKMLCDLYFQKARRGLPNMDFDDRDILSRLLPQREIDEVYADRKVLTQLMRDYEEKTARNEIASEEAAAIDEVRERITEKYTKSPLPLLSIALADVNYKLSRLEEAVKSPKSSAALESRAKLAIGTMTLDETGRPVFKELPPAGNAGSGGEKAGQAALRAAKLKELLELDYDDFAAEKNDTVKSLVVSAYVPAAADSGQPPAEMILAEVEERKAELTSRKNELESIYTSAKNSFIETLAGIVQKLLCVKVFFDHATDRGGDGAAIEGKEGLIVANCHPGELLDPAVINKFTRLMKHYGKDEVKKKIWFGILPHVKKGPGGNKHSGVLGRRDKEVQSESKSSDEFATLSEAFSILGIMQEAKIITFFNFEPTPDNTFARLTGEVIDENRRRLEGLNNNEYAVFVYPNFTLMADKLIKMPDSDEQILAPAVMIDASYVAAGLLVASQQARILKKHFGKRVLPENVNVHINFEDDEIASDFLTNFNCELASNWERPLKEAINESRFGFVFCGDEKFVPGSKSGELKNSYVYLARTMAQNGKGVYKPLYSALTKNFLYAYIKNFGETGEDQLKAFFKDVQDWDVQAKGKPESVNLILRPEDSVKRDADDRGKINIQFGKDNEFLDVQINEEEKED